MGFITKDVIQRGKQLAQSHPLVTTATQVYSVPSDVSETEVETIFIANTQPNELFVSVFHDNDGTTFDDTTALIFNVRLPKETSLILTGGGRPLLRMSADTSGNLAVQTDKADEATFSVYGQEIRY